MKIEKVSEEIVAELFTKGADCAQIVFAYVSERVGVSSEDAFKIASAFGGGLGCGFTCGGLVAGMMALGAKYGHYRESDMLERRNVIIEKRAEYQKKFLEEVGKINCNDILGHDVGSPEGFRKILEEKLFFTVCTKVVCSACKILDEMI